MEEKKIFSAIPAIMGEIGHIGKERRNSQQGFMFRGVDQVMNTMKPLLSKHGVFVVPEVLSTQREERATKSGGNLIYTVHTVRFHFYASDGSVVTATVVGEGMDSADKSSNKAMAVAFKYACFQVFCIPTEEMAKDDPDYGSPEESRSVRPTPAPRQAPAPQPTPQRQRGPAPEAYKQIAAAKTMEDLIAVWNSFTAEQQADQTITKLVGQRRAEIERYGSAPGKGNNNA